METYYEYSVQSSNNTCINIRTRNDAYRKAREYSIINGTADVYGRDWQTDIRYMIARAKNGRVYTVKERV